MQTPNPVTLTGKPIKRGKHTLIKITCPYCGLQHNLTPGLRVPPCGSHQPEYNVQEDTTQQQKG